MMLLSMLVLISLLTEGGHVKLSVRGLDNVEVFAGGEAILTCQVDLPYKFCSFNSPTGTTFSMDPQVEYQDGRISFAGSHDDDEEKMTCGMKISPVTEADGGTWECKITVVKEGVADSQKSQANVTVLDPSKDTRMEMAEKEDLEVKEMEKTANDTKGDNVTASEMGNVEPSITSGTEFDYNNTENNSSQTRDPSLHLHSNLNQMSASTASSNYLKSQFSSTTTAEFEEMNVSTSSLKPQVEDNEEDSGSFSSHLAEVHVAIAVIVIILTLAIILITVIAKIKSKLCFKEFLKDEDAEKCDGQKETSPNNSKDLNEETKSFK